MSDPQLGNERQKTRFPVLRWSSLGRGVKLFLRFITVVIELGLLWIGGMVVFTETSDEVGMMAAWDLLAVVYLGIGLIGVRSFGSQTADDENTAWWNHLWVRRLLGWYSGLLPVLFSLLGLTAAVSVTVLGKTSTGEDAFGLKISGALAMVLAWLLLHVSYSRRYRWFYERDGGGLEFPGETETPSEIDFLYFAMTLGSSFATSDVDVTTSRMRWHVLIHSVIGFFYNAIVLAVAFRILTGG